MGSYRVRWKDVRISLAGSVLHVSSSLMKDDFFYVTNHNNIISHRKQYDTRFIKRRAQRRFRLRSMLSIFYYVCSAQKRVFRPSQIITTLILLWLWCDSIHRIAEMKPIPSGLWITSWKGALGVIKMLCSNRTSSYDMSEKCLE